ncbi:MAG: hypothetical protein E7059_09030 [Treponema bryantii]|nr:hypothetical protein [Treponema bryantii]MBR6583630.1 hypothetical protein [Treponema sp.]
MKVLELRNLQREEGQIFYLRKYTCVIAIEFPTGIELLDIKFNIETSPLGTKNVELILLSEVNYPLLSVRRAILEFLLVEEQEGRLPC